MLTIAKAKKASNKAAKAATVAPAVAPTADTSKADQRAAEQAKRLETLNAARTIARTKYAGASLSVHASNKSRTFSAYAERVNAPVQRANSETERDTSALLVAFKHCDAANTFNPCDYAADAGAISRLASLGFLSVAGERLALTPSGLSRAKAIAAKA